MQLLQGRLPEPKASERAIPSPEELPEPEEARSLETLEEAGTTSHKRFHDLYMEPAPIMEKPKRDRFTRARLELRGRSLREAFVLKEVLGPPKGME